MKKWNDLFSEEPTKQHEQNVLNSAQKALADIREREPAPGGENKSSLLEKLWLPGLGIGVTAVLAMIFFNQKRAMLQQEMTLADLVDDTADIDDLMDEDLDLDMLAELDEFEELNDSGILDKELGDERS